MKKFYSTMLKHAIQYIGLPLVYLGVALLCAHHFLNLHHHNWILFTSLALVIIGIIGHTINDKRQTNY